MVSKVSFPTHLARIHHQVPVYLIIAGLNDSFLSWILGYLIGTLDPLPSKPTLRVSAPFVPFELLAFWDLLEFDPVRLKLKHLLRHCKEAGK